MPRFCDVVLALEFVTLLESGKCDSRRKSENFA